MNTAQLVIGIRGFSHPGDNRPGEFHVHQLADELPYHVPAGVIFHGEKNGGDEQERAGAGFHNEEIGQYDGKCQQKQGFLNGKAITHSKSIVAHLRWDLRAVFRLALAEGHIERDPTPALFTPKKARVGVKRVMNRKEAQQHIEALDLREKVVDYLGLFIGMRPGEILALQRRHIAEDCSELVIEQRLYRGNIDDPKTTSSRRTVGIPSETAAVLREWMKVVGRKPNAWVFASENPAKPMWRDNVWYRHMQPKLEKVGLGWANFQVLRRTHASLGHDLKVDPKVAADQRGHGIGVALDVYTQSSIEARRGAAEKLEQAVLSRKKRSDAA